MFRNYLLTAWNVFMRRKLFTAINLVCIVLTLVVLMVVTAIAIVVPSSRTLPASTIPFAAPSNVNSSS